MAESSLALADTDGSARTAAAAAPATAAPAMGVSHPMSSTDWA
jgi:hypothetical protein